MGHRIELGEIEVVNIHPDISLLVVFLMMTKEDNSHYVGDITIADMAGF